MVNAVLDSSRREFARRRIVEARSWASGEDRDPMTRPSEDDLIARYFAPAGRGGRLGLRDDAACIRPTPGCDLVLTTDALVAACTSFPTIPPTPSPQGAAVNLSDLAAKGATPRGFLLSLALPKDWTEDWLAAFARASAKAPTPAPARCWGAIP